MALTHCCTFQNQNDLVYKIIFIILGLSSNAVLYLIIGHEGFILGHLQPAGQADARRARSPWRPVPSHRMTQGTLHSGKFPGHQEHLLRCPADGPCKGEKASDGQSMHS